jgi:hypothetical protein
MARNRGPVVMLDASFISDLKIVRLRAKHGMAGVGTFVHLICIMRTNGGRMSFGDLPGLGFPGPVADVEKMVRDCIEIGLFESDGDAFFSQRLMSDIAEYESRVSAQVSAAYETNAKRYAKRGAKRTPSVNLSVNALNQSVDFGFKAFWDVYPRKVGRVAASKAYAKAVKTVSPSTLLDGLKRACRDWTIARTEPRFIPHAASWINGARWEDQEVIKSEPPKIDYGKTGAF